MKTSVASRWRVALLLALLALSLSTAARAADLVETIQLFRTGKYVECIEAAGKAIAAHDFNENYRLLKIRAEMELGRYADALATLDEALKRFPSSLQLRWIGRDVVRFNQQPERVAQFDAEITELLRRSSWQYRDSMSQITIGRFFLSQGVDPKKVLDAIYNDVKKRAPNLPEAYLASGELALTKHDYQLAAEAFAQAVKLDASDPEAHLGLARAFAPSEPKKAEEALEAGLKINPRHVGSLLFLVNEHIDAERYDEAEAVLGQIAQINPHQPKAWAYRAVLAHLKSDPKSEARHRQAALRFWPTNPEVDHLIGEKLSQKYRFAEGAAYQRQALEFDPTFLPAKMQLAQDLLRLGDEDAGWRLADEVYGQDGYNVVAHNLMTLQDNLAKFRTLEGDGFQVRMDAREADIYGQRVVDLLSRAKHRLCEKYDVTIDEPVIVEMFPRQADFAIRTFGLPGGAGFLGVCFGTVITANSPAALKETQANWEATLWHEFCHVVTLHKTHNKMPRWLSEGISVYEERQADPTWGQSLNPRYREMLLGDDLTPVSELSGAFLNPRTPLHLQFAYFESSLVVEYLVEQHGLDTVQRILDDLGNGLAINEALSRHVEPLEALDADFAAFARQRAEGMAPNADWAEPELPRRADSATVAAWVKEHPHNYPGLRRLAKQFIAEKQWQAAKEPLETMLRLYSHDSGSDNPYTLLAQVHRELGENSAERAVLEKLAALSASDVETLERLTELTREAEDWTMTRDYALRWLAINPLQPAPHRAAATAAEHLHDDALAIESYRALLLLDPFDPAELHLQLATALQRTGDLPTAKRHALLALEETPRYRAAHRRLLEIVRAMEK